MVKDAAFGNNPRQRLDVYRPRTIGPAALPIIIFFYGGSWSSGSKSGYSFVGRALASRGFLVVIPDYRLVPEARFPVFLEDNAMAVRWVRAHGAALGGEPGRLILAGHSAGAYNAAMLALDPRWLGIDRQWVCGLIGLAGPYDFSTSSGPVVSRRLCRGFEARNDAARQFRRRRRSAGISCDGREGRCGSTRQ